MRRTPILLVAILFAAAAPAEAAGRVPACFGRAATLVGTLGDDVLRAGRDDVVNGLGGDDVIYGHEWSDALCGGAGDDWIRGTHPDADLINGGDGNDWIYGRAQSDRLYGGAGDDVLVGDRPGPALWRYGSAHDRLYGGSGNDRLLGFAHVDELYGGAGDDLLEGGADSDKLFPEGGDDVVRGGDDPDPDMVVYEDAPGPVTVDLAAGVASGDGADRLEEVEDASGSAFDDHFFGSAEPNFFAGGEGADYMDGREGDDGFTPDMRAVYGGVVPVDRPGDDVVEGGPGKDMLMISPADPDMPLEVDLTIGRALGDGTDLLSSIESLSLGSYAGVRAIGNDEDNLIYVYAGGAYIEARGGDDWIVVNVSDSEIDGGDGFDRCDYAVLVRNCEEHSAP